MTDFVDSVAFVSASYPKGSSRDEYYPVTAVPARMEGNGGAEDVLLVGISGFNCNSRDAAFLQVFQAAHNLDNNLVRRAEKAVLDCETTASTAIVVGVSLGGMAAQQLCCRDTMRRKFRKISCVTSAAPQVGPRSAWNENYSLTQLLDAADPIHLLSVHGILTALSRLFNVNGMSRALDGFARHIRSCKKYSNTIDVHKYANLDRSTWREFDAVGAKGNTTLTFNVGERYFY